MMWSQYWSHEIIGLKLFLGNTIKDVRVSCDFWRYIPTYPCPIHYVLSIYVLQAWCTMCDFPWHTYWLPTQKSDFLYGRSLIKNLQVCFLCVYRLIICRKSLLVTILSKNLTDFSTQQYCHVKCPFKVLIKFIYSEKATKFCEIFTLLLTVCTVVKSKVKISQNFVAFSEYINFKIRTQIT